MRTSMLLLPRQTPSPYGNAPHTTQPYVLSHTSPLLQEISLTEVLPSVYHLYGWYMDVNTINRWDAGMSETEKITINLGLVDLGQVDLLVQEGFYSNRTDFIRTAIRNQVATHADEVRQTVARKTLVLGLEHYTRRDLEAVREAGETLEIRVLGLASIGEDVDPELARETISSLTVLGALRASPAVKSALKD